MQKNDPAYHSYGGRGISICKRWDKFENFISDMGSKPTEKHSIDRINNDGNYTPSNCRWATKKEQVRNRRTTNFVTIRNETRPLQEWAEIVNLDYKILWERFKDGHRGEKLLVPSRIVKNNQAISK